MGGHEPAFEVHSGEIVETTTLDAHGYDENDRSICEGPNPLTGPFFINEAKPGDCIGVRIIDLSPNRSSCWTRRLLAPHLLTPELLSRFPELLIGIPGEGKHVDWAIAPDGRTVRVVEEPYRESVPSIDLAPMLGCIGVAPPEGQAIVTTTAGAHGGNMDYVGIAPGSTLYFPVFVPGAHLYLGDGHATQGHGEIGGTGTEVSMDVRFEVRLLKGHRIGWPRGENPTHFFTIGNARPLENALQHATSEMFAWLVDDYRLGIVDASLLMAQSVEYEVGNVFDPAYTMVCKIPRRHLPDHPLPREV